jgi:LPS export ABC transporter permease LptG
VLLAVLINLGRLTKTNEVLAVKAGAVSLYRLALPLVVAGAVLSVAIYLMQDFVLPHSNRIQDSYQAVIKGHQPQTFSDPGKKWMKGSADQFYYYTFFDRETNVFGNLYMIRVDPETWDFREWAFAPRAEFRNGVWITEGGWIRQMQPDRRLTYRRFESLPRTDIDRPEYFKEDVRESDQMNYAELRRYVAQLKQSGFDVTRLTLDLYRKLSFPLVTFIMVLIGVPFSFKTGRKGAFYGIALCVAIGILYWFTFELFGKLGGINRLEPFIAAWFPNLIFGAGGLWLMLRVKT